VLCILHRGFFVRGPWIRQGLVSPRPSVHLLPPLLLRSSLRCRRTVGLLGVGIFFFCCVFASRCRSLARGSVPACFRLRGDLLA
jgi:hypothetical protein